MGARVYIVDNSLWRIYWSIEVMRAFGIKVCGIIKYHEAGAADTDDCDSTVMRVPVTDVYSQAELCSQLDGLCGHPDVLFLMLYDLRTGCASQPCKRVHVRYVSGRAENVRSRFYFYQPCCSWYKAAMLQDFPGRVVESSFFPDTGVLLDVLQLKRIVSEFERSFEENGLNY